MVLIYICGDDELRGRYNIRVKGSLSKIDNERLDEAQDELFRIESIKKDYIYQMLFPIPKIANYIQVDKEDIRSQKNGRSNEENKAKEDIPTKSKSVIGIITGSTLSEPAKNSIAQQMREQLPCLPDIKNNNSASNKA